MKPQLTGTVEGLTKPTSAGCTTPAVTGSRYDKRAVIGVLQRDGTFEARTIKRPTRKIRTAIVRDRVSKGATIYTDELSAYKSLGKTFKHDAVMTPPGRVGAWRRSH